MLKITKLWLFTSAMHVDDNFQANVLCVWLFIQHSMKVDHFSWLSLRVYLHYIVLYMYIPYLYYMYHIASYFGTDLIFMKIKFMKLNYTMITKINPGTATRARLSLLVVSGRNQLFCSNCSYNLCLVLPSDLGLNSAMKASKLNLLTSLHKKISKKKSS